MKKSQYQHYFKDKKITVMGIGLLGRGLGDIRFLAECGARITATDLRSKTTLKEPLSLLKKFNNIKFTLDRHLVRDFKKRDLIVYAAGIKKENKYLQTALQEHTLCSMSFGLVMDILDKEGIDTTLIGITGTKGKSTTTAMIENILKKSGLRYHLAGNVRNVANLPLLKKIKSGDIILAELDSWQLQSMHDINRSPDIAVFTNFFEDHMNYYDGSMQAYFNDKSGIYCYQKKDGYLITSTNAKKAIQEYASTKPVAQHIVAQPDDLPKTWKYQVFGDHNLENIALSFHVGKVLGIKHNVIKEALTTFTGVDGRFQYMGTSSKRKLIFINDNNSTTPSSTIRSLDAVKKEFPHKRIILLAGGADKNFQYKEFAQYISKNVDYLFLFAGNATDAIKKELPGTYKSFTTTLSMRTAFNLALREAEDGDVIILSPAAASFGLFKNEYERNDQFVERVKRYLRKA
jgi:UDP-N-acetylmuramoylalanine--D-glutamate ligase